MFSIVLLCLLFAQTASALSVIATIPVGSSPKDIAYDSGKGEMFVANCCADTVSVINDASHTVVDTIPVGNSPNGVAYDSGKGEIFVTNFNDDTVSVINDATNTVIATIPVGAGPPDVAYDSGKGEIFVTNNLDNTVSVIDDTTNTVITTIPVGAGPADVAYDSAKGEIFVTNQNSDTVSIIDDSTNTVIATIPVGLEPVGMAYDSAKGEIFVTNFNGNNVSVIDDTTNTVIATIPVGSSPVGATYDSAKGEIFVVNSFSGNVSVIDDITNTVIATIPVGTGPYSAAYDSARQEIFVTNDGDDTVSVISDPVQSPASSGGRDVTIYHPPSLGNDYHYPYPGGFTLNNKSFDITQYGITIPQQVLNLGQQDNFTFKIYDERGGSTISHVGMYIHFKGDASVANSDTSFVWDKQDGVRITDPENIFLDANVTHHYDGNFAYVSIKFTPVKVMPDSSILMRMWDDKRASIDVPINGAIIIVDQNAPVPVKQVPSNQYDDYHALVNLLDSDGYQMPSILHRIQNGSDLASTISVYWVYDKDTDKLTMVETFNDGTMIGDTVFNLQKKPSEPTLTDHDYVYIPTQNNRQDPEQEKIVMHQEEVKAEKIVQLMNVMKKSS